MLLSKFTPQLGRKFGSPGLIFDKVSGQKESIVAMLMIRKKQMEVLEEYSLDAFVDRMVNHLRFAFEAEVRDIPDDELRELIRKGVVNAEQYGIEDEADVERFIEYVARFGADFGQTTQTIWADEILSNMEIDGTEKMNMIDDYDLFELNT